MASARVQSSKNTDRRECRSLPSGYCGSSHADNAASWWSASITRTRWPAAAHAAASSTVVVVFPAPPFWFTTTNTRGADACRNVGGTRICGRQD
nr:hypothetical protein [Streptomyces sp. NA03103]